jgi:cell division protein FtsX
MDKKSIITGIIIGLVSNTIGLLIVGLLTAKMAGRSESVLQVFEAAVLENFIGKLISLGAILNLICFFYFIRKQKDSHAAGILIATFLIPVGTFITKL